MEGNIILTLLQRLSLGILLCLILTGTSANAASEQSQQEEIDVSMLAEMDFSELDQLLGENEATASFDFKGLVEKLIAGEEIDKKWLFDSIVNALLGEVNQSRDYMIQIILIVAIFALLYNFANVFESAAVTDISFYLVYMILLALLMKSFLLMQGILTETLTTLMDFMRALLPAFCLSMVLSTGTITAMGFYQLTLFLIYLIEGLLIYVVVPAVQIYVMLEWMNHLTKEDIISKLTDLIKSGVEWVLKFLFTLVIGINVVQGLLSPVIDSFKSGLIAKSASMLPGVGGSIRAVAEIMVGSGVIIKNGVGVAGIVIVLVLCAGPMIKVGIMALLYKLSAAVIQPVADNRICSCINGIGEGAKLLGKVMITANVMFLVTIALVTAASTWNR